VRTILDHRRGSTPPIDEERGLEIIGRYSAEYREQVSRLAPLINDFSKFVPRRRKRKLHIGLFGYSRSVGGITLPRAISFTAALYSIGIPPEVLGMNALTEDDMQFLRQIWSHLEEDLGDAIRYLNEESLHLLPDDLQKRLRQMLRDFPVDEEHRKISSELLRMYKDRHVTGIEEGILRAAAIRKFLG
jgi:phosphoenolpyruvate carboxylase